MYTFEDRGGRSLTLRPEMTPNVIRAYLENSLGQKDKIVKLYYLGPIFRYEKPQAGRFRQHHQFGAEAIGGADPALDAELVEIAMRLYVEIGLKGLKAAVNSVGCKKCRPPYNALLREYLNSRQASLCPDCKRRAHSNPLRVFDCKESICAQAIAMAPSITDNLCDECREHFESFCCFLEEAGIEYAVNPRLVRGLDYYTRTAFEIISEDLGAQNAVGGGGRYDDLIELLGGPPTPAVGFGTGMERMLMIMSRRGTPGAPEERGPVAVVVWEKESQKEGRSMLRALRCAGIAAEMDFSLGSLKSQLRRAHRGGSRCVLLMGRDELAKGAVKFKNMETGEEREIAAGDAVAAVKEECGAGRPGTAE